MEFTLVYEGKLKSEGSGKKRPKEKMEIRRKLHPQLRELWGFNTTLKQITEFAQEDAAGLGFIAKNFKRRAFGFLPLIRKIENQTCGIDILFLRRGDPGTLIELGGDLDNRIKILFDALSIPSNDQIKSDAPKSDEDPFFCLLEDDSLITEFRVRSDVLLKPLKNQEERDSVHLIIHVTCNDPWKSFAPLLPR